MAKYTFVLNFFFPLLLNNEFEVCKFTDVFIFVFHNVQQQLWC